MICEYQFSRLRVCVTREEGWLEYSRQRGRPTEGMETMETCQSKMYSAQLQHKEHGGVAGDEVEG